MHTKFENTFQTMTYVEFIGYYLFTNNKFLLKNPVTIFAILYVFIT